MVVTKAPREKSMEKSAVDLNYRFEYGYLM
jgi:hypothetical protein